MSAEDGKLVLLHKATLAYKTKFNAEPEMAVFAPGRVNLIGEHTDYNDGFVLPFALPFCTVIVGSVANFTSTSTIVSSNIPSSDNVVQFDISKGLSKGSPSWANYVKGTVVQYATDLPPSFAFNAVILSNVPIGSGLSSSASLEVATATLLEKLCKLNVDSVTKALRCQKAEHTFADTPCGIMDQYISAMGKEGNLLLLDCRSNEYQLVPYGGDHGIDTPVIVVTNSNIRHSLGDSEYPDRVRQCKEAVAIIRKYYPEVKALRDCSMDMLMDAKKRSEHSNDHNGDNKHGKHAKNHKKHKKREDKDVFSEKAFMRARHCISEDQRTQKTVDLLAKGDFAGVGNLMTQSHRSLQYDYEVSCEELDTLVDSALKVKGVYGSRMTGGGFGGCTVTLVKRSAVKELVAHLKAAYPLCETYETTPAAGAGELGLEKEAAVVRIGSGISLGGDDKADSVWSHPWALPGVGLAAVLVVVGMVISRKR